MSRKKIIILAAVLFLLVTIGVFWLVYKPAVEKGASFIMIKIKPSPNPVSASPTPTGMIPKQNIDEKGVYVTELDWNSIKLDTTDKIGVNQVANPEINDKLLERFKNYFGFSGNPVSDNENAIAYSNEQDATTFYVSKYDWHANFYRDLISRPIEPETKRFTEAEIKNKLLDIVGQVAAMPNNIKLEFGKTERQDLGDMNYVPSDNPNSRIVYIEMNYTVDGHPIYTNIGTAVKARFFDDGTLLTFSLLLPFSIKNSVGQFPSKTFEEIKKIPASDFRTLAIKGGEGTDVYSEDLGVLINKVTMNKGYLGYVYQADDKYLQPYYVFEGVGMVKNKLTSLTIGIPALANNIYKQ
jgi:hypothetical protein